MKKISQLAFCSVVASLNVLFLFISQFFPIFSYSVCGACGALVLILGLELGGRMAFTTYIVVCLASLFLVSSKENVFLYILFIGYYPIIKIKLDNMKNILFRGILKLLLFLAVSFAINAMLFLLFGLKNEREKQYLVVGIFMFIIGFVVYDWFLGEFKKRYYFKIKERFF